MPKTLIYILGAGRSGTTLLDIVLGNNYNTISLGEINRFFRRNGIPPKRDIGSEVYEFWLKYSETLSNSLNAPYELCEKQFRKNEYHSSWLKCLFRSNDSPYKRNLQIQYQILADITEHSTMVESSKFPCRALNISNYVSKEIIDVKYVYIRKDPVSVIKSFQKQNLEQPSKNFFVANIYYLVVNLLCWLTVKTLKCKGKEVYNIKYEDLLLGREKELRKIGNELRIDFEPLEKLVAENKPLNTGYLFDGNRIRLKHTLLLRPLEKTKLNTLKDYFTRVFNLLVY